MKFLSLDFKNAGWFFKDVQKFDNKDFVFDLEGTQSRKSFNKQYKEPITVHQINGMLHVLFGERPPSSLRKTFIEEIPEIREMANNGWLKINTYSYLNKSGGFSYYYEKMRTKKSIYNSTEKCNSMLYWKRMERFLEQPLYDEFVDIIKTVLNIGPTKINFIETIKMLRNHLNDPNVKIILDKLLKNKKTPLYNIITKDIYWDENGYKGNTDFNANPLIMIRTNSAVTEIVRLSGKIIIPINDDKWVDRLSNFPGVATILDGGLVTIDSLKDDYEYFDSDFLGFKKISEISDELI